MFLTGIDFPVFIRCNTVSLFKYSRKIIAVVKTAFCGNNGNRIHRSCKFYYEFTTSASEIFVSYLSGTGTNDMVILVNGKEVQTFATSSDYSNMNYVTTGVSGVSGKTVTIKAKNNSPLRIFAIIERFN